MPKITIDDKLNPPLEVGDKITGDIRMNEAIITIGEGLKKTTVKTTSNTGMGLRLMLANLDTKIEEEKFKQYTHLKNPYNTFQSFVGEFNSATRSYFLRAESNNGKKAIGLYVRQGVIPGSLKGHDSQNL